MQPWQLDHQVLQADDRGRSVAFQAALLFPYPLRRTSFGMRDLRLRVNVLASAQGHTMTNRFNAFRDEAAQRRELRRPAGSGGQVLDPGVHGPGVETTQVPVVQGPVPLQRFADVTQRLGGAHPGRLRRQAAVHLQRGRCYHV